MRGGSGAEGRSKGSGAHRRDEAITPSRGRLDEARLFRIIPEQPPQLADVGPEEAAADINPSPDRLEQLRLGQEALGVLGEITQEREGLRPQG